MSHPLPPKSQGSLSLSLGVGEMHVCPFLHLFSFLWGFPLSSSLLACRQMRETLSDFCGFSHQASGPWFSSPGGLLPLLCSLPLIPPPLVQPPGHTVEPGGRQGRLCAHSTTAQGWERGVTISMSPA